MVEDLAATRHPSDGAGRVWLVEGPKTVRVSERGTWRFGFEVGPQGIAEGGHLVFQPPPFWGWDPPQDQASQGPGFVAVVAQPDDVRLVSRTIQGMWSLTVEERSLRPGEQIELLYGGDAGARSDRFSERESAFWFGVDGDGDGVRGTLPTPVLVEVNPGPPARASVTWPSVSEPGQPVTLRVAILDERGNGPVPWSGVLAFEGPEGLSHPERVMVASHSEGVTQVQVTPTQPGVYRMSVVGEGGVTGRSNPMVVRAGAQPILWGDLQIHTGRSDGTGTPAEVWHYAREVAGLDVAAVTDHDHWGMQFLDQTPGLWRESLEAARAAHAPGEFVALPGFEWTSWLYGHRHVLWFGGEPRLISSMDPQTDTPDELWAALEGQPVLTVAHHSAGGPVAVDWTFAPDPELEPVTEVVSVHGNSESPRSPAPIYASIPGNFVRDQLRRGIRLGMLGSSDGHDGHPGLGQLNAPSGGLAGILANERTTEAVYEALRQRRVYATNGPRIVLRFDVNGTPMGGTHTLADTPVEATLRVVGSSPIASVEVVRRDGERLLVAGEGRTGLHHTWTVHNPDPGDFVYVVVVQEDGGAAWSSPVWFDR